MSRGADIEVSVAAPAFNEEESIGAVVKDWVKILDEQEFGWEIVITDDGSVDRTSDVLEALGESRLRVIRFDSNRGYGRALSAALAEARGQYLVTIDSDGQFDLKDMGLLLAMLRESGLDLVTGYRRQKKDSKIKVVADRVLNLIVRVTFGVRLRDTNCALKVMTREVARAVDIEAAGFPTPTEIVIRAAHLGYKVGEAPVDHRPRQGGESKLRAFSSGLSFLLFLAYLRLQLWMIGRGVIKRKG